jgi:hypothetical protein
VGRDWGRGRTYAGSAHHLREGGLLLEGEGVLHGGSLELLLHGLERLYLLHGLEGERLVVYPATSFTPRHARTTATAAPTRRRVKVLLHPRRLRHAPHGRVVGLMRGGAIGGGEDGANSVTPAAHLPRRKVQVMALRAQPIS